MISSYCFEPYFYSLYNTVEATVIYTYNLCNLIQIKKSQTIKKIQNNVTKF